MEDDDPFEELPSQRREGPARKRSREKVEKRKEVRELRAKREQMRRRAFKELRLQRQMASEQPRDEAVGGRDALAELRKAPRLKTKLAHVIEDEAPKMKQTWDRRWRAQQRKELGRTAASAAGVDADTEAGPDVEQRVPQDLFEDALRRAYLQEHNRRRSEAARAVSEKAAGMNGVALPTREDAMAMSLMELRQTLWNIGLPAVGLPSGPEARKLKDDELRKRLLEAKIMLQRRLLEAIGENEENQAGVRTTSSEAASA